MTRRRPKHAITARQLQRHVAMTRTSNTIEDRARTEALLTSTRAVILLQLPAFELSPNARPHWTVKTELTRAHRWRAKNACQELFKRMGVQPPHWGAVTVRRTFYFERPGRRDRSNFEARCKAYDDGFTDAGLWIDDQHVMTMPSVMAVDAQCPRLVVEVTRA